MLAKKEIKTSRKHIHNKKKKEIKIIIEKSINIQNIIYNIRYNK